MTVPYSPDNPPKVGETVRITRRDEHDAPWVQPDAVVTVWSIDRAIRHPVCVTGPHGIMDVLGFDQIEPVTDASAAAAPQPAFTVTKDTVFRINAAETDFTLVEIESGVLEFCGNGAHYIGTADIAPLHALLGAYLAAKEQGS
jgi:hypothetical protein